MGENDNINACEYAYMSAEYNVIKKKNTEIAKELAESRKLYAMMLKERNYLHAKNTNLLLQNGVLKNYISTTLHNARDVLKSIVAASNGLTTIICSQPAVLDDFEKSDITNCSDNTNKSANASTTMKKQTVNPMIRGHTIKRPTIRLKKLSIDYPGLSTSQENNSEEEDTSPSTSNTAESMVEEEEEQEEDNVEEEREQEMEQDAEDSSSNNDNDGYIIPDQFETIAEEDEGNPEENMTPNVSNCVDTVPSNAGPLISTVFKNVDLRVYVTPSEEIAALTRDISNSQLGENSSNGLNNSPNSPVVGTRRKVKRLISPSNSIIHSARKKANLGPSPETSANETEDESFAPRVTRNRRIHSSIYNASKRVSLTDSTEKTSPVRGNEYIPRITRNKASESMNATEGEVSVPRVQSRKAVSRKTVDTSLNTTESDYEMTSRNTGNSTLVNNVGSSKHSLDTSEDNTILKSSSSEKSDQDTILGGNIKMNHLSVNYTMDETLDMDARSTATSTPYHRNISILNEKSLLSPRRSEIKRKRGRKKIIATNACSVVLKRMLVKSPKASPSSLQTKRKYSKTKRKDGENEDQDVHVTPIRPRGRPKRATKPVDLREPSLVSPCIRPSRTSKPMDLKEPSLISKLRRT